MLRLTPAKRLEAWLVRLACLGALGAGGCVMVDDDLRDYEECAIDSDCDSFRCEPLTADWPDRTTTNRICTVGCSEDSDCLRTVSGLLGSCESLGDGPLLCYETCEADDDCAPGFRCGDIDAETVCLPY